MFNRLKQIIKDRPAKSIIVGSVVLIAVIVIAWFVSIGIQRGLVGDNGLRVVSVSDTYTTSPFINIELNENINQGSIEINIDGATDYEVQYIPSKTIQIFIDLSERQPMSKLTVFLSVEGQFGKRLLNEKIEVEIKDAFVEGKIVELPAEQTEFMLRYQDYDFNAAALQNDPIGNYIPYTDENFSIDALPVFSEDYKAVTIDKPYISIQFFMPQPTEDSRYVWEASKNTALAQIRAWGLDPDNYNLSFHDETGKHIEPAVDK